MIEEINSCDANPGQETCKYVHAPQSVRFYTALASASEDCLLHDCPADDRYYKNKSRKSPIEPGRHNETRDKELAGFFATEGLSF